MPENDLPRPTLKITKTIKKPKIKQVTSDEYKQMLEEKKLSDLENIKKLVKMSMNIKDKEIQYDDNIRRQFEELVHRKEREAALRRKKEIDTLLGNKPTPKTVEADLLNETNEVEDEANKSHDKYTAEEIYLRAEMTLQERRFGSPEFSLRSNDLMNNLPTNDLNNVHPGVELKSGPKLLKGSKFNENPYFDVEVEESESELDSEQEELMNKYGKLLQNPENILFSQVNQKTKSTPVAKLDPPQNSKAESNEKSSSESTFTNEFESSKTTNNNDKDLDMSAIPGHTDHEAHDENADIKITVENIHNEISSIEVQGITKDQSNASKSKFK